ncbi:hypothetical protein N7510_008506 [Penicillium lagena]|uniref:uncharacterized protein n=1 Tax=Penicillium lagena TaxID=94218 RepID=UPI0025404E55|nr:uncharacterized protein N7510_008506 [Penicillium lagena]KAJ5605725.1 hypothetical protein N7510_008506 [Penicillium lagena]
MTDATDAQPTLAMREGSTSWKAYIRTILYCFIVSFATLQYGLDISIINAAQALKGFLKVFGYPDRNAPNGYGIEPSFQQSITSIMNVGVIVGSFTLEFFTHRLGRRKNFIVGSVTGIGANLILVLSTNKSAIIFGRFLFGVSNGLFIGFTSIYISEAAPLHLRGALVTFVQVEAERRRTMLTMAAGTMHGASGFPFISSYSTYFFQISGSQRPFIDSIIVTTMSLVGAFSGVFLNRFVGRRHVLLSGFGIQAILMFVIATVWTVDPGTVSTGKTIVAMVVIFQAVYAAIVGPTSWIVASEIPNNRLRAMTFGFGNGIGFIAYFLIAFTTPYFINPESLNIGPKVGFIWLGSNLIAFTFVFFCIPETHRRSLENIDEMFYNKVPTRKFKSYQCTGVVQRHEKLSEKALDIETDAGTTTQLGEQPARKD